MELASLKPCCAAGGTETGEWNEGQSNDLKMVWSRSESGLGSWRIYGSARNK